MQNKVEKVEPEKENANEVVKTTQVDLVETEEDEVDAEDNSLNSNKEKLELEGGLIGGDIAIDNYQTKTEEKTNKIEQKEGTTPKIGGKRGRAMVSPHTDYSPENEYANKRHTMLSDPPIHDYASLLVTPTAEQEEQRKADQRKKIEAELKIKFSLDPVEKKDEQQY